METIRFFEKKKTCKSEPKNVLTRISERALEILKRDLNEKQFIEANNLLRDQRYTREIKERWKNNVLSGAVCDDSEKQDEIWARNLAREIYEKVKLN